MVLMTTLPKPVCGNGRSSGLTNLTPVNMLDPFEPRERRARGFRFDPRPSPTARRLDVDVPIRALEAKEYPAYGNNHQEDDPDPQWFQGW